jgi:NitT/TauT family transport system ATP-binding protein
MMMRAGLQDLLPKLWQELGLTILFETHDLDEAIHLAKRAIALSASPGALAYGVNAPLANRQRQAETRNDPVFLVLRERLHRLRMRQVSAGREGTS